jgi:hypothetical protein
MLLDLILNFAAELVHTLFVEEVCRRVRERGARLVQQRRRRRLIRQAMHKLATGERKNL